MGFVWLGNAARCHIGITDSFNLFQPMFFCNAVKLAKTGIEFTNQILWRKIFSDGGKADEIGKQHTDAVIMFGFYKLFGLQLFGNAGGENVEQQAVRFFAFLIEISCQYQYQKAREKLNKEKIGRDVDESFFIADMWGDKIWTIFFNPKKRQRHAGRERKGQHGRTPPG